jgi:hypothetical protein
MKLKYDYQTKGFRLEFPEGYQYYSKPDMVASFRNDGCKILEVWENLSYHRVGFF